MGQREALKAGSKGIERTPSTSDTARSGRYTIGPLSVTQGQ